MARKARIVTINDKPSRDPYWFDTTYNQMFKKWQEA